MSKQFVDWLNVLNENDTLFESIFIFVEIHRLVSIRLNHLQDLKTQFNWENQLFIVYGCPWYYTFFYIYTEAVQAYVTTLAIN